MTVVFVPIGWWVTDKIIEPRLGTYDPPASAPIDLSAAELSKAERRGLFWAGVAALLVIGLWAWLTVGPQPSFIDMSAETAEARMNPFYQSLVAGFFVLFLMCGVFYGVAAGTVKSERDVVRMTGQSMADMGPYIVLAFVAAHFVAMFNWSNLGAIIAINGAESLKASGLSAPGLLAGIVVLSAMINLVIGSASAKWAALAPVMVPMLMLLGISPEMTTAAYRMGDSVTNIVTPLMVYFPLILTFCQRWNPEFGLGSLMAVMLPYSLFFMIAGVAMTAGWVWLELPLGPGAGLHYELPQSPAPAASAG
jgi:aminobenzoyl-glutamate transport protein